MQNPWFSSLVLLMFIGLVSCENGTNTYDVKEEILEEGNEIPVRRVKMEEFKPSDTKMMSSAMSRMMLLPDLKKFAGIIVAAEMADLLSDNAGPFTVFAPPNLAFDSLTASDIKTLSKPQNKANLESLIKSHIVEGSFDSAIIFQTIKKKGQMRLKTLAGGVLIATIENDSILISDNSEKKALMHKTDILSSNAVVHVLDQMLGVD